ncbi:MAG: DUF4174 domain-containing protein [Gammaproteobacteria bacterium]
MAYIVTSSVFFFLFATTTTITTASAAPEVTLDTFQWRKRVILSFIHEADTQSARHQREYRDEAPHDWRDRDLVLVEIGPFNRVLVDGEPHKSINGAELRNSFAADVDSYVAVLVGKDGFEKLRSDQPISNETLFATIDAMPMRQREMRRD